MGAYAGPTQSWFVPTNSGRTYVATKLVIQSGLVLNLDAGSLSSYPGSGTTWTDLSGNGNNGTLANGPTYNSGNGGSIVFDGVDDNVNCGNSGTIPGTNGSNVTVSAWVKASSPGNGYRGIVVKNQNYGLFMLDGVLVTFDWGSGNILRSVGENIALGTWHNVVLSVSINSGSPSNNAIVYINGVSRLATTVKMANNDANLFVGAPTAGAIQNMAGNISVVHLYNRILTATEISQNYNALKGRFGL